MEVAIGGILDPLSEKGSLDSVRWEVPSVLTFGDVKFPVDSKSNDGVS